VIRSKTSIVLHVNTIYSKKKNKTASNIIEIRFLDKDCFETIYQLTVANLPPYQLQNQDLLRYKQIFDQDLRNSISNQNEKGFWTLMEELIPKKVYRLPLLNGKFCAMLSAEASAYSNYYKRPLVIFILLIQKDHLGIPITNTSLQPAIEEISSFLIKFLTPTSSFPVSLQLSEAQIVSPSLFLTFYRLATPPTNNTQHT
jgi:hypothetical protein